jgi:hypothetical protein
MAGDLLGGTEWYIVAVFQFFGGVFGHDVTAREPNLVANMIFQSRLTL